MNNRRFRWVRRKTSDGEVYYNRDTRNVYRSLPEGLYSNKFDFWSLSTFDPEAPLKVYFDFTYLCNLECRHCITNSSPRADRGKELKSERIKSIMDELAAIGVLELGIGGGEPLCYSEIFPLLSYADALHLNTVLTTNGILVTADIAKQIKESAVSEVRVGFEGSKPVHDNIRGPGVYHKALKAMEILINSGLTAVPRLTISKEDTDGLNILFKDLKSIGVTAVKAALVVPRGRASLAQNRDLFKYDRDNKIIDLLFEIAQKYSIKVTIPADLASCAELADGGELRVGKTKGCGGGSITVYISPQGIVQPCSGMTEYVFGEVKENSFMSAWKSEAACSWRNRMCSCLCIQKTLKYLWTDIDNRQELANKPV